MMEIFLGILLALVVCALYFIGCLIVIKLAAATLVDICRVARRFIACPPSRDRRM